MVPAIDGFANQSQYLVTSEDGSVVYEFDRTGRHMRTLDARTGVPLLTMGYTVGGWLDTLTDRNGLVTTFVRNPSDPSDLDAIVGPFGETTTITTDADGLITAVNNAENEEVGFTYLATSDLLESMTDPRGNTYSFTYDLTGRLASDTDPATGTQMLARTETPEGWNIVHTDGEGRTRLNEIELGEGSRETRRYTDTAGFITEIVEDNAGAQTTTYPDGTVVFVEEYGDPRWGMNAPMPQTTVILPSGLTFAATLDREVTLATENDPLSLTTLTTTSTVNGRIATSVYDAATRTTTVTSPEGRVSTFIEDPVSQLTDVFVPGFPDGSTTYDTSGRVLSVTSDTGTETRTSSFTYLDDPMGNEFGYLNTATDPLLQTTTYDRDRIGRPTLITLPDTEQIAMSYDDNGNLTSLTPPGQPAHTFAYTALNQPETYTAPDATPSNDEVGYDYNLARQLELIDMPSGALVDIVYDTFGRLEAVNASDGTSRDTAYNGTTGQVTSVTSDEGNVLTFGYDGFLTTSVTWSGQVAGSVEYNYAQDPDDPANTTTDLLVTEVTINGADPVRYLYDDDLLLSGAGDLSISRNLSSGFVEGTSIGRVDSTMTYTDFAELQDLTYTDTTSATVLYDADFVYDDLGRIEQMVETVGGVTTTFDYEYSPVGELTDVYANGVAGVPVHVRRQRQPYVGR